VGRGLEKGGGGGVEKGWGGEEGCREGGRGEGEL